MAPETNPVPPDARLLALAAALANLRNALNQASLVLHDALMQIDGPQRAAAAEHVRQLLAKISVEGSDSRF